MPEETTKRVLIVEDDQDYRVRMQDFFSSNGFGVQVAETGEEVMEKVLVYKPHIIILDLLLPKVDGFEVLKRIRTYPDPDVANTAVVVLSNLSSESDMNRAKEGNVQAYLVKALTSQAQIMEKAKEIVSGAN